MTVGLTLASLAKPCIAGLEIEKEENNVEGAEDLDFPKGMVDFPSSSPLSSSSPEENCIFFQNLGGL